MAERFTEQPPLKGGVVWQGCCWGSTGSIRPPQRRCLMGKSTGTAWKRLVGAVTEEDTSPEHVWCIPTLLPVM